MNELEKLRSQANEIVEQERRRNLSDTESIENILLFPLDFFPEKYRQAIVEISEAIDTPVEIPAMALLSLIGASIGRTRCVQAKMGWKEHPNLFMAIVGRSGIGKSPACDAIFKHIQKIEEVWYNELKEKKSE